MLQVDGRSTARRVFFACLFIELALVLLDYHVNYGRLTQIGAIRRLTNIAREDGLASWFATTQTLLVALTAWVLWLGARAVQAPRWRRVGWTVIAVVFTYMAIDDGAQIHERLGTAYSVTGGPGSSRFPSFTWQLLFIPLLGTAIAFGSYFLWLQLRGTRAKWLVAAAVLMFGTAVSLDFLEGLDRDHPWNLYAFVADRYALGDFTRARFGQPAFDTLLHFSRSLEELLEMLANTCFWTALLSHLRHVMPEIRFRAGDP